MEERRWALEAQRRQELAMSQAFGRDDHIKKVKRVLLRIMRHGFKSGQEALRNGWTLRRVERVLGKSLNGYNRKLCSLSATEKDLKNAMKSGHERLP